MDKKLIEQNVLITEEDLENVVGGAESWDKYHEALPGGIKASINCPRCGAQISMVGARQIMQGNHVFLIVTCFSCNSMNSIRKDSFFI